MEIQYDFQEFSIQNLASSTGLSQHKFKKIHIAIKYISKTPYPCKFRIKAFENVQCHCEIRRCVEYNLKRKQINFNMINSLPIFWAIWRYCAHIIFFEDILKWCPYNLVSCIWVDDLPLSSIEIARIGKNYKIIVDDPSCCHDEIWSRYNLLAPW